MTSRRSVLAAGVAACFGGLGLGIKEADAAVARQQEEDWLKAVPKNACDCHHHIIGPYDTFPMVKDRIYTPPTASVAQVQQMHKALHITRSVVIQPSFYGTDNNCLLAALRQLGPSSRGIVVLASDVTPTEIDAFRLAGVKGLRVNQTGGASDPATLAALIDRTGRQADELGWHVQLFLPIKTVATLVPTLERSPATFVLDHFAGADATGAEQPGLAPILGLMASGKVYVKLTAPYHASPAPLYPGMDALARAFVKANPQRVLWGTDWPHTDSSRKPAIGAKDISPFYPIDNANLLKQFFNWVPERTLRETILVSNPAELFSFT